MTIYYSGFNPSEAAAGSKGSAAFLGAINTATVYLYRRSATALTGSDKPNGNVIYTFNTSNVDVSAVTNSWTSAIPGGSNPLYVVSVTASSTNPTDTILTADWSTPVILVQDGSSAKSITITTTRQIITYDATDTLSPSTQDTTFTANKQNTTATVNWTVTRVDGTVPTSPLSASTGDTVTMTAANFNTARGSTEGLVITATATDGVTMTDKVTVMKLKNGSAGAPGTAAVSGMLTADALQLNAYADGTPVSALPTTIGTFKMYNGTTDITTGNGVTYSVVSSTSGVTVTINATTGVYTLTGMTVDTGSATLQAVFGASTITKIVSITKNKVGYEIAAALPSTNLFAGRMVFLTTDNKLYRYTGSQWTTAVGTVDLILGAGSQNLVANPRGQEGITGWALAESVNLGSYDFQGHINWYGTGRYGFWLQTKSSSSVGIAVGCKAFPVIPGKKYAVRVKVGSSATSTTSLFISMQYTTTEPASGIINSGNRVGVTHMLSDGPMPGAETDYSYVWTAPSGANWASLAIYNWAGFAGDVYFSEAEVTEQLPSLKVADGAVTGAKLGIGVGGNLLVGAVPGSNAMRYLQMSWNPDVVTYYSALDGSSVSGTPTSTMIQSPGFTLWAAGTGWQMNDNSNFAIYQNNNNNGATYHLSDFAFTRQQDASGNQDTLYPIEPNKYYEFSAYIGAHRCKSELLMIWYDSARAQIGTSVYSSGVNDQSTLGTQGGTQLSNYVRQVARGQAPSNARFLVCVLRKYHTTTGQTDSWIFGTRPQLAETVANATEAIPYSVPAYAILNAEAITAGSISAGKLAANSVVADNITAGAIIASKLTLANLTDVFPDPQFYDKAWWNVSDISLITAVAGGASEPYRYMNAAAGAVCDRLSTPIPIEHNSWFRTKLRIFISTDAAGWWGCTQHWPSQMWNIPAPYTTRSDVDSNGYPLIDMAATTIPKGSWQTYENVAQYTATAVAPYLQQRTRMNLTAGTVKWVWEITRAYGSDLIVDGSITANELAADSVIASKIQAGAVTAGKISVTSLSAITATIGTLRTSTTGGRTEISDNVIKVFDGTGTLRVKIGNLAL